MSQKTHLLSKEQLAATSGRCDLTEGELRTLGSFAALANRRRPPAKYLEIGVFGGGTLKWLKDNVPGVNCTGVDLFEDLQMVDNTHISGNYTMADVQSFVGDDVRLIRGDSAAVLPAMTERFDLIFIDGNHTYWATKVDLENSMALLARDGFVALHNCSSHGYPDWEYYNRVDGGPWQISIEMMQDHGWLMLNHTDRLAVFTRRPGYLMI